MARDPGYLFLYGTLLPGRVPLALRSAAAQLGTPRPAMVRGRLYDLGRYPAAVPDEGAGCWIRGRVSSYTNGAILTELDRYEGYDPRNPAASLFVRRQCEAVLSGGGRLTCWVYAYNRDPGAGRLIRDGVYRGDRLRQ
ncbi:MAG: gamma-glutamylcyclotransferase [Gemmatimonadales bacterium]|nr:gamma-glutamylcyclotransferase [Gemmatimonadales bacterium]NIN12021.1 gamma-glutamylcyclotransferase [Gemmatimonadales bacterium]NIN50552.1 gamma-glutamylcyclotransferase [Gemmatimonadales bacterium]NIP08016.1 gamma-glutamylcyclotransferase [Gemmatimonadales bacterium]NIR02028.1 gamma-glutamylcyclotransferase [Gemmatimonadales bacterium]